MRLAFIQQSAGSSHPSYNKTSYKGSRTYHSQWTAVLESSTCFRDPGKDKITQPYRAAERPLHRYARCGLAGEVTDRETRQRIIGSLATSRFDDRA